MITSAYSTYRVKRTGREQFGEVMQQIGTSILCSVLDMMITTTFSLKPQCPHTNSPNLSLYISLKNELREFDKRSRYFLSCDHFINSHLLTVYGYCLEKFDLGHYWELKG